MRVKLARKRKPLIKNYKKEEMIVILASVSVVVLLALPEYDRQDFFTVGMTVLADWVASFFPQLEVIAATRVNPEKLKIVLASVMIMMPVQVVYFLWTMPAKLAEERVLFGRLVSRLWISVWVTVAVIIVLFVMLYVLTAPGWENPGSLVQRYMPIVRSDIGSGLLLLVPSGGVAHGCSLILVFTAFIFIELINRKEKR